MSSNSYNNPENVNAFVQALATCTDEISPDDARWAEIAAYNREHDDPRLERIARYNRAHRGISWMADVGAVNYISLPPRDSGHRRRNVLALTNDGARP